MFFSLEEVSLGRTRSRKGAAAPTNEAGKSLVVLLAANLLVTYALGSFEVSIALQGRQTLGLDPYRVGIMFMECSLIMVAIQALIFCFPVLKRLSGTLVLLFGFLAMTAGFLLLPIVTAFNAMLVVVALVAGGSGFLLPFLTYRISFSAPLGLGTTLGLQTAAASLGQGIGSAAGGWLFELWNNSSFLMTAALSLLGALLALFVGNTPAKDSGE
jgi:MFS transporter, DHA1 family, multidrug resistance protein